MRQKFLHLLLVLFLAASVFAQQQQQLGVDQYAPSAERLRAHVLMLASDEFEGRRTGTRGADAAANYIAREFARLGLKPGGEVHRLAPAPGIMRFMQSFPIVTSANGRTVVSVDESRAFALTLNEDGYGPSDHSSFYAKRVPVLFFWTGTHEDYHKPSDTSDRINYTDEARILSFIAQVLRSIDASEKRPTYAIAKSDNTRGAVAFRVYLGTIPSYADSGDGLLLDGVREDSPAARAGLKAGDRIVRLAGREVRNVYDYTYALAEMKAGEEYEMEAVRGAEKLKLKIIPAQRKQ
ncbi:MAG TPA: PDZ domain-containing protein [Pyrinomonadaceae bacterium]|jgi:hypothetical protein